MGRTTSGVASSLTGALSPPSELSGNSIGRRYEQSLVSLIIFNLLWSEFVETNATFQSASTDLDHALVVCDLTQIPAEGSGCRCRQPTRDQDL